MNDFNMGNSRYDERAKKRRQNRLLNPLIAIVGLLIMIVGWNILFNGSEETTTPEQSQSTENEPANNGSDNIADDDGKDEQNSDETSADEPTPSDKDDTVSDESPSDEKSSEESADDQSEAEDGIEKKNNEEVQGESGTLEGPWEPIGTVQEEPHNTTYNTDSIDWEERLKAMAYATNIPQENMILWWLGNGGTAQTSVGYVSSNQVSNKVYIVDLVWVENEGWKPAAVKYTTVENPKKWVNEQK